MPNWSWSTGATVIFHIALLFFVIPIKYNGPSDTEFQFKQYLLDFNKSYENDTVYQLRLSAFETSLNNIEHLNKNRTVRSAEYGLTKFSDLLPKEFANLYLQSDLGKIILQRQLKANNKDHSSEEEEHKRSKRSIVIEALPRRVDWREKHIIGDIQNQGNCGACWAFSVIETVESMNAINTGQFTKLSIQQMIDCAGNNNDGCQGGDICSLLEWMGDQKIKVKTEVEYPLTYRQDKCKKSNDTLGVTVDNFACESFVGDEIILLDLLARHGPLAAAINANTWQNYVGGVIKYHCSGNPGDMNHAVQIVGYNLETEIPYYIVRNTWGNDFGDKGYLYIAVGSNICGIANEVSVIKV